MKRKDFIQQASMLAGATFLAKESWAIDSKAMDSMQDRNKTQLIKNVRLETGFTYDGEEVVGTETRLFTLHIADGLIQKIATNNPLAEAFDAQGMLMLPAFKDYHIHLDKTFYAGPWQARLKKNRSVQDMIAYEQMTMPELLKTSTYRAEKMIELLQQNGVSFARSHVNIEPTSGLQSLKNVELAIQNKNNSFQTELVAFPQHGIFFSKSEQLMKDVAKLDIDFIGGLDPSSIEGNVEKTIDFIVDLALQNNKGIDIHLHEQGAAGLQSITYLLKKVAENPVLQGKTFLSHCFALASMPSATLEGVAEQLAAQQVGIVSTVPFGRTIMPIPLLYKKGVDVRTGNDSIIDHWNTFGSGSILEKANIMAQLYGWSTELELSRCLKIATHNILPLDDKGNQQWPKVGTEATFILLDASCSAEAVARISAIKNFMYHGKMLF